MWESLGVSEFQNFRASEFQISEFQSFRASGLRGSDVQNFNFRASEFQSFRCLSITNHILNGSASSLWLHEPNMLHWVVKPPNAWRWRVAMQKPQKPMIGRCPTAIMPATLPRPNCKRVVGGPSEKHKLHSLSHSTRNSKHVTRQCEKLVLCLEVCRWQGHRKPSALGLACFMRRDMAV